MGEGKDRRFGSGQGPTEDWWTGIFFLNRHLGKLPTPHCITQDAFQMAVMEIQLKLFQSKNRIVLGHVSEKTKDKTTKKQR